MEMAWCNNCYRSFKSQEALEQHIQNSPAHIPSFDCFLCNRSFKSQEALEQHIQNSPAHIPSFDCVLCNRSFKSQEALEQHIQNSPAHIPSFDCFLCNRSFKSQEALEQHIQNSPAHFPSFDCDLCKRSFKSLLALEQHIQYSSAHLAPPSTPLNRFFQSFPQFEFDPNLPAAVSYARLQQFYGWKRGSVDSEEAWTKYQDALREEFSLWFGSENDLAAWHSLCRAVNLHPLPKTCSQCKTAIRKLYINIVDLIDWARGGRNVGGIRQFESLTELREYSKKSHKIFHNTLDDSGDGDVVLRHLLRFIHRRVDNQDE
ncbi:C2H2-type zinc finger protein [Aspergillus affinis]|uniref:C2H2-type zinc finger protein n=1 Tax=Aspergillus affinis TaxID=1070780 RepID=UPI0022FF2335|nr:uncharacterized protein KD926_002206 [Aspergillus affinis]KAI9036176.1 hypothetical protein KD926_002206 [Aspergillus affinis]